jgi:glycosyltransferase involved in cell wall biosynthesis
VIDAVEAARRAKLRVQEIQERRNRTPPPLRTVDHSLVPAVYYLCPHLDRPSGGVRTIYRHVDALNAGGIRAMVVHAKDGFSCTWFRHNTQVTGARSVALSPQDVLVVPEWYGPGLNALPAGPRIVIFNQNAYRTFDALDASAGAGSPYRGIAGLEAMIVVSADSTDYLRFAFPELRITRVRNVIDPAVFYPPKHSAGRRIAYMPRKRADDARQVLRLLHARGSLRGWEVIAIDGRSEAETADLLRTSAIFLSFSDQEGFGMPPAEAMACGCYVVGFPGFGGREYFEPSFSTPIEDGDVLAFAKAMASILGAERASFAERARSASDYVLARYSPSGQREDLLGFFGPMLQSQ